MPAKTKQLPRPCPICRNSSGTMQIVIFRNNYDDKITCRIGHYDAAGYKKIKKIVDERKLNPVHTNSEKNRKDIQIKQRRWCSFRIDGNFVLQHMKQISNFFDLFGEVKINKSRKSVTFSAQKLLELHNAIRRSGWHTVPNWSERYRSRREVRGRIALRDPKNQDESVVMGFTGMQCTQCKSWKTRPYGHHSLHAIWCLDCKYIWKKYNFL